MKKKSRTLVVVGVGAAALVAFSQGKGQEKTRRNAALDLFQTTQGELGLQGASQKAVELYRKSGGRDEAFIARLNTLARQD